METSLTLSGILILSGVMLLGALVPGISVLTVSARSAALGFHHGLLTAAGIVAGDILFILIALYGLSVLHDWLGNDFTLIKIVGGAYLIWLGTTLWRTRPDTGQKHQQPSRSSSFTAGLLITLADQKAIIFYFGLFPAFIEPGPVSLTDTLLILVIALLAVGMPKVFYAFLADRAGRILNATSHAARITSRLAGSVMGMVGVALLFQAFSGNVFVQ